MPPHGNAWVTINLLQEEKVLTMWIEFLQHVSGVVISPATGTELPLHNQACNKHTHDNT